MRVLSLSAERALRRLEIELCHHAGQDNGDLIVTHRDFVAYGIRNCSVGPALAELEALGLIKITERGKRCAGVEYRKPRRFKLTTRPERTPGECGWQRIKTVEQAEAILAALKEKNAYYRNGSKIATETVAQKAKAYYRNGSTKPTTETVALSTSRGDTPATMEAA